MASRKPYRFKTISEFHKSRGLPLPEHPLISVIDYALIKHSDENNSMSWVLDFYAISLKKSSHIKFKYGHQQCDFDEGSMFFMSPNQVFKVEIDKNHTPVNSGWLLLIHPDFIWGTALAKTIKQYDFFDYAINEALFLSPKEESTINSIIHNIQQEYQINIDKFSKQIISTHIENLLSYSERFYNRQFITREKTNHQILERLEKLLKDYFNSNNLEIKGLPSVQYVSEELNISQSYLGSLLRILTGQNTQQHIHKKLIEKAKEKLATTNKTISEIAYELGFEYSQSFSKLFKLKTNQSPTEFRTNFN
tara:strand:+ start:1100 stop:2020 length:921 start_codon:yes stop_codon:yes gene_type:complete